MGGTLPDDFITWLEVILGSAMKLLFKLSNHYLFLGGESDMLMCDPDSGYNYGDHLFDN